MRLIYAEQLKQLRDDVISGKADIRTEGDLIDACPTVNPYEWISVKDRLPEEHMDVLIYHGRFIGDMMSVYTYIGNNEWRDEHGYRSSTRDEGITHWMHLPTPPTEKENL